MAGKGLTKRELIELLECAKTSKEQNKAVKLLKRYDPVANFDLDHFGTKENLQPKKFNRIVAFICARCGVVKQTNTKVFWNFQQDGKITKKVACVTCANQMLEKAEVAKLRKMHQNAGLVPKGFGLGLHD